MFRQCGLRSISGHDALSFNNGIEVIGDQIGQGFGFARWPANFDFIDLGGAGKAEVNTQVVLREIASPAVDLVGLRHAACSDRDSSIECEAVAFGA